MIAKIAVFVISGKFMAPISRKEEYIDFDFQTWDTFSYIRFSCKKDFLQLTTADNSEIGTKDFDV